MSEELLVDVNEFETRVALVRHSKLQEVHLERSGMYSLTGNLYKGRVTRVVPAMQAAFVDIGMARPGFLHVRDLHGLRYEDPGVALDVRSYLHAGQELIVQVVKDPINTKGPRLSTNIAVPARYVVLLPEDHHIGVSQRIEDDEQREQLRTWVADGREKLASGHGYIVRTAAEFASEEQVNADLKFLDRLWSEVSERSRTAAAGDLVFEELPLHTRLVRDLVGPSIEVIRINDRNTYQRVQRYVEKYLPEYSEKIQQHDGVVPLFELHGVEAAMMRALEPRVDLSSGGYLVIEQTEAMTTIDVNSGAFLGSQNLETTAYRTNMEAADAIPRQLQLRNIGGIIVVDFIDMSSQDHRDDVLARLRSTGEGGSGRFRAGGFSPLGLVEISRKRTRASLRQQVCEPCQTCGGLGFGKSAESTCYDIFRALQRDSERGGQRSQDAEYVVRAAQDVIDCLLSDEADHIHAVERQVGRAVRYQVEPTSGPGEFDLVLSLKSSRDRSQRLYRSADP